MTAMLATYKGQEVVVGLNWQVGARPSGLKAIKVGAKGQGYAVMRGIMAETHDADLLGQAPLSSMIGRDIADLTDICAVILSLQTGGFFGAFFESGVPRVGAERIFTNVSEALEWASKSKSNGFANSILISWDLREDVSKADPDAKVLDFPEAATEDNTDRAPSALPTVQAYRVVTAKQGIAASSAVLMLIVGSLYGPEVFATFGKAKEEATTMVAAPLIEQAIDRQAFAKECSTSLRSDWPGVPGWDIVAWGCSLPSAVRPIGLQGQAVAWKEYTRPARYANIPSSGIASARLAEYMFQEWQHDKQIVEGRILAARPLDLGWVPYTPQETEQVDFRTRVENAFVAVLAENLPTAANVSGATTGQASDRSSLDLQLATGIDEAFSRASFLSQIDVSAIRTSQDGLTTITLEQRRSRRSVNPSDIDIAASQGAL